MAHLKQEKIIIEGKLAELKVRAEEEGAHHASIINKL